MRKSDEIIIKKVQLKSNHDNTFRQQKFLHFTFTKQKSSIDNILLFKNFFLFITPISLNLDGNFCDEMFRYFSEILQQTKKYQAQTKDKQLEFLEADFNDIWKASLKTPSNPSKLNKLDKGYYYENRDNQVQKNIYVEEFYIHDICIRFNFNSSPIMFRELSMNSTLKFLIVLMSNLKNVQINFSKFTIQQ